MQPTSRDDFENSKSQKYFANIKFIFDKNKFLFIKIQILTQHIQGMIQPICVIISIKHKRIDIHKQYH